ncbi:hypothetical protein ABPG73_019736 [Tetrahymena malaccensis]
MMIIYQKSFIFFVLLAFFKQALAVVTSVKYDDSDLSTQVLVISSSKFAATHEYSNSTYGLNIYSLSNPSDIQAYQIDSICTNLTSVDYLQGTFLMLTQTAIYYLDSQQNPLSFSNKYILSKQLTSLNNAEGTKVILGYIDGTIQIIDFFDNTFLWQLNGCTGQTFSVSYILYDNNIVGLCNNMLISWDKTQFSLSGSTKIFSQLATFSVTLKAGNINFLFSFGQGTNRRFMVGIISNYIKAFQLTSNVFSPDSSITSISLLGQSQITYFKQQQNLIYWRTLTSIKIYRYKVSTINDSLTSQISCSPNISSILSDNLDFIINCNTVGSSNQYSIQKISFVPLICNPGCAQCSPSGPPYQCLACDTANNFSLNPSGQCVCAANYYLDTLKSQCINCPIQCNGCQISNGQLECLACSGSIIPSNNRQNFSQSKLCSCQDRYYDDGTLTCKPCDITCLNCINNQRNTCKSCDSSSDHRILNVANQTCDCQVNYHENSPITQQCFQCSANQYFDTSSSTCKICPIQCNGCQISSGQLQCLACNSSISSSDYRQTFAQNGLCSCQDRYYDDGTLTCKPCDVTCLTCTNNQRNSCISCDSMNDHRQINSTNKTCDCQSTYSENNPVTKQCIQCNSSQYFDTSNNTCKSCPIQCNGCQISSGQLQCLACNSSISSSDYRQPFNQNVLCSCQDRYYDDGTLTCKPCDVTCLTCTNNQRNSCISCDSMNDHRQINSTNKTCDCQSTYSENNPVTKQCIQCNSSQYYDSSNSQCKNCPIQCNGCQISSGQLQCLACNSSISSSDYRQTFAQNTLCSCQDRYYDDGTLTCKPCDVTCLTCTNNQRNSCISCDSMNDHRQINSTNKTCDCQSTYSENNPVTKQCTQCNSSQYFDTSNNTCKSCPIQCNGCQISSGQLQCLACNSSISSSDYRQTFAQNKLCSCQDRYYDDGTLTCKPCDVTCFTCIDNKSISCLSCNLSTDHREFDNSNKTCNCSMYFTENSPKTKQCASCHPTCLTCNGVSPQQCLTCDSSKNRKLDINNSCKCMDGFYEDSTNNCTPCHVTCQTCSGGSENDCTNCNSANYRAKYQNKCICSPGYTENTPITSSCQQCHYSCLTCFGPSSNQCNSCDGIQNQRLLYQNVMCNCKQGFYDKGIAQCNPCNLTCESCVGGNTSINCLSCSQSSFRHLSNSQCVCNKGYVEYIPQQQDCQCDTNQNRILNNKGQCVCQDGYYEDSNQNCVKCHYSCKTCFGGLSNQCLTCENQYNRLWNNNVCSCADNYFENGVSQCQKCNNPKCQICDKNTQECLGCFDSQNRYLDKQGLCLCKSGYKEDQNNSSNVCFLKCIENCETCMPDNLQSCLQCKKYFSFNQNTSKCSRDQIPTGIPDGKVQDVSKYSSISSYISIAVSTTSSIALSFVSSNDRIFKVLFTLQKINFLLLINFPFPEILYQFQKSISGTNPLTLLSQINFFPYFLNENEEQYSGPLQDGKFKSEQIKTSIINNAGGIIPVLSVYLLLLLISTIAYKKQKQKHLEFQNRYKGLCLPIDIYIQQNKQGIFIKLLNKLLGLLTLQVFELLCVVFIFSITLQILSYTYNTIDSEISIIMVKSIFFCFLFVFSIASFFYYVNFINKYFLLKQREETSSYKTLIEMNYSFLICPNSKKDEEKLTAQIDLELPDIIFQSYLQDYIKLLFFTRNFIFINDTVELIIIPLCIIAPFQNCFTQIILCLIFQSLLCIFVLTRRPSKLNLKNIELFLQNIIWIATFVCYLILAYQIEYKIDLNNLNNNDQQKLNLLSVIIMILCLVQLFISPFFVIASIVQQFPNIIKKIRQKMKKQDKKSEDILDQQKSNMDIQLNQIYTIGEPGNKLDSQKMDGECEYLENMDYEQGVFAVLTKQGSSLKLFKAQVISNKINIDNINQFTLQNISSVNRADSNKIILGSQDGTIQMKDFKNVSYSAKFKGCDKQVYSVSYIENSPIVIGLCENTLISWDRSVADQTSPEYIYNQKKQTYIQPSGTNSVNKYLFSFMDGSDRLLYVKCFNNQFEIHTYDGNFQKRNPLKVQTYGCQNFKSYGNMMFCLSPTNIKSFQILNSNKILQDSVTQNKNCAPKEFSLVQESVDGILFCQDQTTSQFNIQKINYLSISCSPQCSSCSNPNSLDCSKCNSDQNFIKKNNQCVCDQDFYLDKIQNICISCNEHVSSSCNNSCHPTCQTCSGNLENQCTKCDETQNRILDNGYCKCKDGFYLDNSNTCTKCNQYCKTCNGPNENNCMSCYENTNRENKSNQCLCQDGYIEYNPKQDSCKIICHPSCQSCNGKTDNQCTQCDSSKNRVLTASNTCICKDGFYQDSNGNCLQCNIQCKTCYGPSENQCLSCQDNTNREYKNNQCICKDGYTENNPKTDSCKILCHSSCLSCNGNAANQCTQCDSSKNRVIFQSNTCICKDGFFQNNNGSCVQCNIKCKTCTGSSEDNCVTCNEDKNRIIKNNQCICKDGFIENNPVLDSCKQNCHYSCMTCNGMQKDQCLSCNQSYFRTLNSSICECNAGYYDAGTDMCNSCDITCKTCSNGNPNSCNSCLESNFRKKIGTSCECIDGYNEYNPKQKTCYKCHYSCLKCGGADQNSCISCDSQNNRVLNGQNCNCRQGYYNIDNNPICAPCDNTCFTCNGNNPNQCLSCDDKQNRELDQNGFCRCKEGYIQDNLGNCVQCHITCKTCTGTRDDQCLSCQENNQRKLDNNKCACKQDYFENDPISASCVQCHYSCEICNKTQINICTKCGNNSNRQIINGICECLDGYYDDGTIQCKPCTNKDCRRCDKTSQKCLECYSDQNREVDIQGNCICKNGYKQSQVNSQSICEFQCSKNCLTCESSNPNSCLKCDQQKQLILDAQTKSCICPSYYYLDSSMSLCKPCIEKCIKCSSSNNLKCDQCEEFYKFNESSQKCERSQVPSGFSESTTQKISQTSEAASYIAIGASAGCSVAMSIVQPNVNFLQQFLSIQKINFLLLINLPIPDILYQFFKSISGTNPLYLLNIINFFPSFLNENEEQYVGTLQNSKFQQEKIKTSVIENIGGIIIVLVATNIFLVFAILIGMRKKMKKKDLQTNLIKNLSIKQIVISNNAKQSQLQPSNFEKIYYQIVTIITIQVHELLAVVLTFGLTLQIFSFANKGMDYSLKILGVKAIFLAVILIYSLGSFIFFIRFINSYYQKKSCQNLFSPQTQKELKFNIKLKKKNKNDLIIQTQNYKLSDIFFQCYIDDYIQFLAISRNFKFIQIAIENIVIPLCIIVPFQDSLIQVLLCLGFQTINFLLVLWIRPFKHILNNLQIFLQNAAWIAIFVLYFLLVYYIRFKMELDNMTQDNIDILTKISTGIMICCILLLFFPLIFAIIKLIKELPNLIKIIKQKLKTDQKCKKQQQFDSNLSNQNLINENNQSNMSNLAIFKNHKIPSYIKETKIQMVKINKQEEKIEKKIFVLKRKQQNLKQSVNLYNLAILSSQQDLETNREMNSSQTDQNQMFCYSKMKRLKNQRSQITQTKFLD